MRTVEVRLYQFDELSDKAKDKAREWMREGESEMFGLFGEIYEPAETAAKLLGITFNRNDVTLNGGGTRSEPDIRWSGFSSQGDGASFTGSYEYRKGSVRDVSKEFGDDESGRELKRIARELADVQRKHGYKITADITQNDAHYSHKYTMGAELGGMEWLQYSDYQQQADELTTTVLDLLRDFVQWVYDNLQAEYEYRLSDEQLEESIRANEYDFRDDGTRSDG